MKLSTSMTTDELLEAIKEIESMRAERDEEKHNSDRLVTVIECFISMIGNVNTVEILMPKVVEILKEQGYGHLADALALTGFAAAFARVDGEK